MIGRNGESDAGFVVLFELLGLHFSFDRGLHDRADFEELGDLIRRFVSGEFCVHFREGLFVNGAIASGVFPRFLGGVGEDGSEELDEGIEDFTDHPDAGLTTIAAGGVAVKTVFGDVDVVGTQVVGRELVDGREDIAEIILRVGVLDLLNDDLKALHDPLVDERKSLRLADLFITHVSEEDLEGVAQTTVGLADLLEEFFAEGNFVLPIHRGDPETENISTILVIEVGGIRRLPFLFGSGLGDFTTIFINHETVGEDGLVWRGITDADTQHERALEPSTVLVGGLKIEVGRAAEFRMSIENGNVRGAGIDPNIEGIATLRRTFGKVEKLGELGVGFFEPHVGAFFFNKVRDLSRKLD